MSSAASDLLTISAEEAYRLHSDPRTIFLDVRSPGDFMSSHIVGALNMPINYLDDRIGTLPQERLLIVYCDIADEAGSISRHVVQLLRSKGYNAFYIADGLGAWKAVGLEVVGGE